MCVIVIIHMHKVMDQIDSNVKQSTYKELFLFKNVTLGNKDETSEILNKNKNLITLE